MGRPHVVCEEEGCDAEGWRIFEERDGRLRIRYWLCRAHHPQGRGSAPAMPAKPPERSQAALAVEKAIKSRPVPAAPVLEAMRPSVVVCAPAPVPKPAVVAAPQPKPETPKRKKRLPAGFSPYDGGPLPEGARILEAGGGAQLVLLAESGGCRVRGCPCAVKRHGLCKAHQIYAGRKPRIKPVWTEAIRARPIKGTCLVEKCYGASAIQGMCRRHYNHAIRCDRADLLLPLVKRYDHDRDAKLRHVAAEWRLRGWAPMKANDPTMLRLIPGEAGDRKNALRRAQAMGLLRCEGRGTLAKWSVVENAG